MFERYTEKARRTIFFARYEASQLGSPYIKPEHLLLGLLRESREVQRHLAVDSEELTKRLRIEVVGPKASTSVDLPLDEACKHVLAHAAEEAEMMGHPHIGTEHLLLGIFREEGSHAVEVLRAMGAPSLEELRKRIRGSEFQESPHRLRAVAGSWPPKLKLLEDGGRELTVALRLPGVPSVGHAVWLKMDGVEERYRVVDVIWAFQGGARQEESILTGVEVHIRKEPSAKK